MTSSKLSLTRSYDSLLPIENDIIFKDFREKTNEEIVYKKEKGSSRGAMVKAISKEITTWGSFDSLLSLIKDIFLPKGYPDSVSDDYLEYQVWDTFQAFCSSISGTLSMQAVMQGIGVGSETATPVAAAITWLMKDGTGMIGSILFAWSKGSKFDADCKKWRLFADVLNDAAMCLELYIPNLLQYSIYLLCISTAMKALVGVAGGATRAALINHQAVHDNSADVAAKDNSQEIFVNLCAMVFGIFILKTVTDKEHQWAVMCTFILFHLIFNYKAVRCLKMDVYNAERYRLSLRSYFATSVVPNIDQVNRNESVFLMKGTSDYDLCGFSICLGYSLKHVVLCQKLPENDLAFLTVLFENKKYLILPYVKQEKLYVAFRDGVEDIDIMKGYFHALFLAVAIKISVGENKLPVIHRSRSQSPAIRIKNVMNFYITSKFELYPSQKLPVLPMLACDDIIDKEFRAFYRQSVDQGWHVSRHLFIVEEWRGEWRLAKKQEAKAPQSASTSSFEMPSARKKTSAMKATTSPTARIVKKTGQRVVKAPRPYDQFIM